MELREDAREQELEMADTTTIDANDTHLTPTKAKCHLQRAQIFDAGETKRTLLKLLSHDVAVPSPSPGLYSRGGSSVWWPSFKRALSGGKSSSVQLSNSRTTRRPFEIEASELKLGEQIGEGLRSEVFQGELEPDSQQVAVSRLRSVFDSKKAEKKSRFVNDFQTLSLTLRHPHIVQLLGVNMDAQEGTMNIVFEYMGGGTLETYFESRSGDGQLHAVPMSVALSYGKQLFQALHFLHDRDDPIIHRDLKPGNLMLSSDYKTLKIKDFGVKKTTDFGLKLLQRAQQNQKPELLGTDLSKLHGPTTKAFTGTARYMAPEIDIKAETAAYTPAVDIYSAALILWFVLEGQRPWERCHGSVAFANAKKGRRPVLCRDDKRYPLSVAALIGQAWSEDPSLRPSAWQVLSALEEIEEELQGDGKVGCMMMPQLFRTSSAPSLFRSSSSTGASSRASKHF
mmetsp:Transcript_24507/g.58276  ORF Transcript_24507/g.58276 Transcript_24507/m.58276 type:complete len:454 (+) Transcript_24507:22-1383(+)